MSTADPFMIDPIFARTASACDLARLSRARVVLAGAGGAAGAIANLVRAGVREFVLIDPDRVEAPNLGTQDYERGDIGRFKVEALGRRLLRINPRVSVLALAQPLESCCGRRMKELVGAPMAVLQRNPAARHEPPRAALLLGMTDHFPAQVFLNQAAVRLGVPSLCVQIYRERGPRIRAHFHASGRNRCLPPLHPGTTLCGLCTGLRQRRRFGWLAACHYQCCQRPHRACSNGAATWSRRRDALAAASARDAGAQPRADAARPGGGG